MDVCLVNMPFASVIIPSIGLAILQATLEAAGISASSVYANLYYFNEVGLDRFQMIRSTKTQDGLGDWVFAHIAFPEFKPDQRTYIQKLVKRNYLLKDHDLDQLENVLLSIREESGRFIKNMAERILEMKPRIVGCTSTVQQHVPSLALLRTIRESAPEVVTMLGGPNCEATMGRTTHSSFSWVDFAVSGEADDLIVPLIRSILEKGSDIKGRDLPEGVFAPVHRLEGYPVKSNGGAGESFRAMGKPLSEQSIPNYDDYFQTLKDLPLLSDKIIPGIPIQTSRGCWWGRRRPCNFCGLNGHQKGFQSKAPGQVLREMEALSKRYGSDRFETVDNIMDMRYYKTLIPEFIKAGSPYRIFYETKSSLNRRQVELLSRSGIIWIQPGVESLHTEVLTLMNKGCKAFHNVRMLKWCRQYGIRAGWNMLHDFPGEDDAWYAQMAELIPLLTHLHPPGTMTPIRYDRFSHYQQQAHEYGLRLHPAPLSAYIYPLSEKELENLVYTFEDEAQAELAKNPLLSVFMARAGLNALKREVLQWANHFWSDNRPVLEIYLEKDALRIRDTRPAAVSPELFLTGIKKDIYLSCEDGRFVDQIIADFKSRGNSREKVEEAIESLTAGKLAVVLDDRLLSLATRGPCPGVPEMKDFPGGNILTRCEEHT